ncbi:uncharacterized protein TRIADDRAFT_62786, partial [Trichoplax adhaerens]
HRQPWTLNTKFEQPAIETETNELPVEKQNEQNRMQTNSPVYINDLLVKEGISSWKIDEQFSERTEVLPAVAENIQLSQVFLPFISEKYIKSDYCLKEISWAIKKEKWIIPVIIENINGWKDSLIALGQDILKKMKEYHNIKFLGQGASTAKLKEELSELLKAIRFCIDIRKLPEKEYLQAYIKALMKGKCKNDFIRIMLIGPENVGKSTILRILIEAEQILDLPSTEVLDKPEKVLNIVTLKLQDGAKQDCNKLYTKKIDTTVTPVKVNQAYKESNPVS